MEDASLSRHNKKFLKTKKGLLTVCLTLILLAVLTIALVVKHNKDAENIDLSKVQALSKAEDCSNTAVNSVSRYKPSYSHLSASIELLNYRGSCLVVNHDYKQANTVFYQLITYYKKENNLQAADDAYQQIGDNNYSISHPIDYSKRPTPDLTPEEAAKVEAHNP